MYRSGPSIGGIIYVVIGIIVAATHGYIDFSSLSSILSMLLAILLWPALFFGVNLHVSLGV